MALSLPTVAPKKFILGLKINCSKCERKLKNLLLRAPGVRSVSIDPKEGTVAISATVEPSRIMTLLDQALSLKAELLWEQTPSASSSSSSSSSSSTRDGRNDLQIVSQPSRKHQVDYQRLSHDTDPDVVAQLQQISKIKGLKSVEVCYSKSEVSRSKAIRLTFKGQNDDFSDKDVEVIIKDEVQNTQIPRNSPVGGGRLCAASSTCCGSHHHHQVVCGCGGDYSVPGYPFSSNNYGNMNWQEPPPPWPAGGYTPSAPPVGTATYYYDKDAPPPPPPPAPVRDNSYFNRFSDDNTSGICNIM